MSMKSKTQYALPSKAPASAECLHTNRLEDADLTLLMLRSTKTQFTEVELKSSQQPESSFKAWKLHRYPPCLNPSSCAKSLLLPKPLEESIRPSTKKEERSLLKKNSKEAHSTQSEPIFQWHKASDSHQSCARTPKEWLSLRTASITGKQYLDSHTKTLRQLSLS